MPPTEMADRLGCQRGVLHLIAVIPLSLFLFDLQFWGAVGGAVLLVSTAAQARRHWWVGLLSVALAATLAYAVGYRIEFMTNPRGGVLYPHHWSWLITLGWIIVVSQGVSVIGQLDTSGKLLTKVFVILSSTLLLISLWQGRLLGVMLLLALLGVVMGLRRRAVPVERWSHAVGYGLAVAAIVGLVKTTTSVALLAPLVALGLPFTGTLSIVYSHGLSFSWLDELKIGRATAIVALYGLSAYMSVLAFLATRLSGESFVWVVGGLSVGVGLALWAAWRLGRTVANNQKLVLLGTPIDRVALDEAVALCESFIASGRRALVCTPDTTAILRAQQDHRLREIYERADLVTADGAGVVWAARLLGAPLRERVSGIDLLEKLFSRGQELKIFLLGATPGVAEQAARRLTEQYPHLRIVGVHHGYFRENDTVLERIRRAQPDMVLIGLGVPRQELWMLENRQKLDAPVLMGVGGCFDVWSGRLARAPRSWQRLGLEWLYRVLQEPRRLIRVSAIPLFVVQVFLVKAVRLLWE